MSTRFYFDADLQKLVKNYNTFYITDEHVFEAHRRKFRNLNTIVIKAGEQYKTQEAINDIIQHLIRYGADRKSFVVGVGGGVVTDLSGYAASVYMRGIAFGFIPTSILAMVDAAIGGKNGIDVGPYKNLVGTITQPKFLLYDTSFLKSLPKGEWINGFAEIIKHACIKDARLFKELEQNVLRTYQKDRPLLTSLIKRNANIKSKVVAADEFEQGERRLLNFGHTWGHAIETKYQLPHGHAISIGMILACRLSEKITGFTQTHRVEALLRQYGLPVSYAVNKKEVFEVLKMDKKKDSAAMNYVLLNSIGKAVVKKIPIDELEDLINSLE